MDHEYEEVADWTDGYSSDATKPPVDRYHPVPKCHTLAEKPIPLPKPSKINKIPSIENPSLTAQRREKLPMPLPHNEGVKLLPPVPAVVETELHSNDKLMPEETIKVANVFSKPYMASRFDQPASKCALTGTDPPPTVEDSEQLYDDVITVKHPPKKMIPPPISLKPSPLARTSSNSYNHDSKPDNTEVKQKPPKIAPPPISKKPVTRTGSLPISCSGLEAAYHNDINEVKQWSPKMVPPPISPKPKPTLPARGDSLPVAKDSCDLEPVIYNDNDKAEQSPKMVPPPISPKPKPNLVAKTDSLPVVGDSHDLEPVIYDEVKQSPKMRVPSPISPKPKPNLVTRADSLPVVENSYDLAESEIYDDVVGVTQSPKISPPPISPKPKPTLPARGDSLPVTKNSHDIEPVTYDDNEAKQSPKMVPPPISPKPKPNLVTRADSSVSGVEKSYDLADHEPAIYDDIDNVKQSPKMSPPPISPKPVSGTDLFTVKQSNYDVEPVIYDDAAVVTRSLQPISPPPVGTKPKQHTSPIKKTPMLGVNAVVTKEKITQCHSVPSPFAIKPNLLAAQRKFSLPGDDKQKQQTSLGTEQRSTDNTVLTKEFATKHSEKVPPPVANKPKRAMLPVRKQMDSRLQNNNASSTAMIPTSVTKPEQHPLPATPMDSDTIPTKQITTTQLITEQEPDMHGNTAGVVPEVASPYISPVAHDEYDTEYVECDPPYLTTMDEDASYDYADAIKLPAAVPSQETTSSQLPMTEEVKNKAYLQSLSHTDVLKLLESMNLSQHKASFQEEQVDGKLLSVLTRDDLKELGVTKGVQLKRLLRLIEGIMSTKDLLENND